MLFSFVLIVASQLDLTRIRRQFVAYFCGRRGNIGDKGGETPIQVSFIPVGMNIAVADEGGNIVAHVRMDDAWIGSIDVSMKKAYTSRAFEIATIDLAKHSQSGGQFFGIHASNDGKIMIFAGGVPLNTRAK